HEPPRCRCGPVFQSTPCTSLLRFHLRKRTYVAVRGDGAGIHTLDSAHDKAYTSVPFKSDTIALEERGIGEIAPLSKLPHVLFFGGGVVIKLGDETIGAIGASGAPGAKLDDTCARAGLDKIPTENALPDRCGKVGRSHAPVAATGN